MATFKNAIRASVGTSATSVYVSPAATTSILLELDLANRTGSEISANVTITDANASVTSFIVQNAVLPVGASINIIAGQKIVLEAGDNIQVQSTAASSLDAVASILEGV